jgi:hypothetical protein
MSNNLFTENEIEIALLALDPTLTTDAPLILIDVITSFPTPTSHTAEIDTFTAMKLSTL